ncbi:MAG: ATP-binding protein [Isosphaeraceae bacterium]
MPRRAGDRLPGHHRPQRPAALAEVVAAETLSRSILEQTVDAVVVGDPGGTLIRAGTAARRLCGREPIGLSFDEAFPLLRRNDPTGCRLALPLSQVISGQTFRGLEARLEANDGSRTFDLLLSVGPLRDVDGLVVGFVATLTDVTEQKRAEEALLARQRELQTLADNTPEILARFDREFRHVFVNAAVEPALGLRRSQFLGKTHRELEMPEAFCTLWEQALRSVFESGGPASIDFEFATPAGLRHYEARLVPEPGSGTVVESILGLTHDVTDRKRYEQSLRDQDRRKDEFLATLAHELRNPLAAIGNAAHIASLSPEDEGTGTWAIEVIERQARQLKHLVDDLLDVSRINLGKIELRRELVDARAIIERAVEVVKPQVLAKEQTLIVELSEPPLPVDADPTRLEQLVVNLLGNASKYTDHHGRITISARRAGSELVLKVADTGIGIAAKDLHRIFEPFGQVDDSLGRSEGGLGIGLTLVRRLTELHGGRVAVASEGLGRGSVFSVGLPLSQAPLPATSPAPETSRVCPTEAHILIVDDNRDGVTGLARLLRRAGFHVDTAHDGPAALALLGEFPPSVALLDIGLPGMDGYQLAAHLRERYGRSIFLYAVSGYGRESDRDRAERAGFDHYLIKPVDPDQLLSLLTAQAVARPV